MMTPEELLDERRSLDFLKGAKRIRVCIMMEEYAKRYHAEQVKSVDLADVGGSLPSNCYGRCDEHNDVCFKEEK